MKAQEYCNSRNTRVTQEMGHGTQGVIFRTAHNTAIKAHSREAAFCREVEIYQQLKARNIAQIQGMTIPRLVDESAELLVFEMSIVHVPCILDFGGAYLEPPKHMENRRGEEWSMLMREEFGDDWPKAQSVIRELEFRAEIYLVDINSGNIKFR